MDRQTKMVAAFWGVVALICLLACTGGDDPLMGYFGEGSSEEKCGYNEARKEDYGDCSGGEVCIWTPFRNGSAGHGPYPTSCGEDPHEEAFCVVPPGEEAVANAPNETVCGCDGKTYPSYIHAHAMGVSIKTYGPCPTPSGKTCTPGQDECDVDVQSVLYGEECIYPEGSCGSGADATCVLDPWSCPDMTNPVCGCDGQTYSNECRATIQGISIDHHGACATTLTGVSEEGDDMNGKLEPTSIPDDEIAPPTTDDL